MPLPPCLLPSTDCTSSCDIAADEPWFGIAIGSACVPIACSTRHRTQKLKLQPLLFLKPTAADHRAPERYLSSRFTTHPLSAIQMCHYKTTLTQILSCSLQSKHETRKSHVYQLCCMHVATLRMALSWSTAWWATTQNEGHVRRNCCRLLT